MRTLMVRAIVAVVGVLALEMLAIFTLDWSPPLWAMVALPLLAGLAAFLVAGRMRALRLQRRRRLRNPLPSHLPSVGELGGHLDR